MQHACAVVQRMTEDRRRVDWRATCSCGFQSPWEQHRSVADLWRTDHLTGPRVEDLFDLDGTPV